MKHEITIHVRLDAKVFRRFSRFNALLLPRKWVRPVQFAALLTGFAIVALLTRRPQSGLIAAVLLVVGLGLPLVYFGTFFVQVNRQVARYHLKTPQPVYTVRLSGDGVDVVNDRKQEAPLNVPWSEVLAAYRDQGCIYLYVSAARVFLLPDGQADVEPAALWAFIETQLGTRALGIASFL